VMVGGPRQGNVIDILRKPDGAIGWMRMGLRLYVRQ